MAKNDLYVDGNITILGDETEFDGVMEYSHNLVVTGKFIIKQIKPDEAAFFLSSVGPFASRAEGYEERPSQIELLKNICNVFNNNKIGVCCVLSAKT